MSRNGSSVSLGKDSYRIGEVASLTQLEPYVLRYWETEFPVLHPPKSPRGQRLYRKTDIETVLTIKRLLYEQGFTIAGARKHLEAADGNPPWAEPSPPVLPPGNPNAPSIRERLRAVRAELQHLLTLLSRR